MAKPRVFVSSTYYDLKHVRSSLDLFIESFGYDPVLSEKGDIAFTHDRPLDESCYREATGADILVLIIGGRYGSEASSQDKKPTRTFFDRYDSITKKEYESAAIRDIPIYILLESGVYSEYQTFLKNKENQSINYAHVDSVNIFCLIEDILARPRNNPVHTFERFADIESWLREQWAGLFRELLTQQSQQQQLLTLTAQVSELKEVNETLKRYMEAVMKGLIPDASNKLIALEEKRLDEIKLVERLKLNDWYNFITDVWGISLENFVEAMTKATSFDDFAEQIGAISKRPDAKKMIEETLQMSNTARKEFNDVRTLLGQSVVAVDDEETPGLTRPSTRPAKKQRAG